MSSAVAKPRAFLSSLHKSIRTNRETKKLKKIQKINEEDENSIITNHHSNPPPPQYLEHDNVYEFNHNNQPNDCYLIPEQKVNNLATATATTTATTSTSATRPSVSPNDIRDTFQLRHSERLKLKKRDMNTLGDEKINYSNHTITNDTKDLYFTPSEHELKFLYNNE